MELLIKLYVLHWLSRIRCALGITMDGKRNMFIVFFFFYYIRTKSKFTISKGFELKIHFDRSWCVLVLMRCHLMAPNMMKICVNYVPHNVPHTMNRVSCPYRTVNDDDNYKNTKFVSFNLSIVFFNLLTNLSRFRQRHETSTQQSTPTSLIHAHIHLALASRHHTPISLLCVSVSLRSCVDRVTVWFIVIVHSVSSFCTFLFYFWWNEWF